MSARFLTEVEIPDFKRKAGYQSSCMFIGSCFTENIGGKMAALKYPVDINPFGNLYNPVSVANGIRFLIQKKRFDNSGLIHHNGLWHSFFHHSRFSSAFAEESLRNINSRLDISSVFLEKADFLFITFGTAWVYEYKSTGQIVSNCHKIPDKEFRRFRLEPEEIVDEFRKLLPELWTFNPGVRVIFTVSPIRHLRDGTIENQRSKSTLLLAVDRLVRELGEERCGYFPAYEIVMDELRDYRFYAEDMIHLSSSAINHIWEKFQVSLIEERSRKISEKIKKITAATEHKPFNRVTKEYLHFLRKSLQITCSIATEFSYINLDFEKSFFSEQIADVEIRLNNLKS